MGKLFTFAEAAAQLEDEEWTKEDFRKYRNLIVDNQFYLTKVQQSYLAEVMGLDYAVRIEDMHYETAI